MTFYTGEQFPEEYRLDAFAAEHGSWNRARRTGYKVIRVPIKDGKATGEYEDFLVGFVTPDGNVWGRPGRRHRRQGRRPAGHRRRLGHRLASRLHRVNSELSPMRNTHPPTIGLIFGLQPSRPTCRSWPRPTLAGSASGSCRRPATSRFSSMARPSSMAAKASSSIGSSRSTARHSCSRRKHTASSGWATADQVIAVEQAIDFFTRADSAHPDRSRSSTPRGRCSGVTGRAYDKRPPRLRRSHPARSQERSSLPRPRPGLACCKKEYDKAIADFDEAIRLDPKSAPAFIGRGASRASKKEYSKAIADFSEAIWLDPLSIAAYDNRGLAWHSKNEYAKAIVDYNLAIRLDSQHTSGLLRPRQRLGGPARFDKAIADFDEAIQIDANCARAHAQSSLALVHLPGRADTATARRPSPRRRKRVS